MNESEVSRSISHFDVFFFLGKQECFTTSNSFRCIPRMDWISPLLFNFATFQFAFPSGNKHSNSDFYFAREINGQKTAELKAVFWPFIPLNQKRKKRLKSLFEIDGKQTIKERFFDKNVLQTAAFDSLETKRSKGVFHFNRGMNGERAAFNSPEKKNVQKTVLQTKQRKIIEKFSLCHWIHTKYHRLSSSHSHASENCSSPTRDDRTIW